VADEREDKQTIPNPNKRVSRASGHCGRGATRRMKRVANDTNRGHPNQHLSDRTPLTPRSALGTDRSPKGHSGCGQGGE
jgi:hypothetical protein